MKRLLIIVAVGLMAGPAVAQDQEPDAAALMEAYAAASRPGKHHQMLQPLIGTWKTTTRAWVAPGAEPIETGGKVQKSWDLDNRFIREELSGETPMGPYHGVGYLGFDNATKQYQGVWLSSMSTGMIHYTGTMNEDGTKLTARGQEADPSTGMMLDFEMTITMDGPDKHTLEFWYLLPENQKMKAFEIVHERS
ncbi:MAG: DUF1579 family protein [Phycisphaerales bacterium]|nr:DUF1579 family protein [Phycisphaerales bacterium]